MLYKFGLFVKVDEEKTVAKPVYLARQIKEQIQKGMEIGLGESDIPILKMWLNSSRINRRKGVRKHGR